MDHIYVPTFLFIVGVFCTFFTGGAAERAGLHSDDKIIKVFTPYFILIISCRWIGSVYVIAYWF